MDTQDHGTGVPVRGVIATLVAVAVLALTATLVSPLQPVAAAPRMAEPEPSTPRDYSPRLGPLFNDPLDPLQSGRINRHIRWSIESVPKGERIRIFSWNVSSDAYERALIAAHRRGVSVRVLMSNGIAEGQAGTGSYSRLKSALSQSQASRRPTQKSWVRTCTNSCRGNGGAAHSKFFLFSRVADRTDVVMVGSPNLTMSAAGNQWNELMTVVNRPLLYETFLAVFDQASRDEPVVPPYVTAEEGDTEAWFTPYTGGTANDPVLGMLNKVKCQGATNALGASRATRLRIAGDAFVGDRGLQIAQRIRQLNQWGCNVKMMYAVMGKRIARVLFDPSGKGPVRAQHYVQDLDCDGVYDRYIHLKSIMVSGNWGDNTNNFVTMNGSHNWSGFGAASDDAGLLVQRESTMLKYTDWFDHMWQNKPPYNGEDPECHSVPGESEDDEEDDTTPRMVAGSAAWGREVLTAETAWKYVNILD